MVAAAGQVAGGEKAAATVENPVVTNPYEAATQGTRTYYPPGSGAQGTGPYSSYGANAPKTLVEQYPELLPLVLQFVYDVEGGRMTNLLIEPALRRLGRSGLPPLIKILESNDPEQRTAALRCLLDLVSPDYPAREAIPAVMKLAKEPGDSSDLQGYALVLLTRLIAVNEPAPPGAGTITPCTGNPIFRGPLLGVVRYIRPDGQIGELKPSEEDLGATLSVYPDYLVLEGNKQYLSFARYIAYKELLELELMR